MLFLEASVTVRFVHLLVTHFLLPPSHQCIHWPCHLGLINICRLRDSSSHSQSNPSSLPVEVKKKAGTRLRAKKHCCPRQGTESPRERMNSQLPNNKERLSPTGPSLTRSQGALFISWQCRMGILEVFFCFLWSLPLAQANGKIYFGFNKVLSSLLLYLVTYMCLEVVKQPVDSWAGLSGNLISWCNIFILLVNGEMLDNNDMSQRNKFYIFRCSRYVLDAPWFKNVV